MHTAFKTEGEQHTIAGEGFYNFNGKFAPPNTEGDSRSTYRQEDYDQAGLSISARRVLFKPLFGLFNQEVNSFKVLPYSD